MQSSARRTIATGHPADAGAVPAWGWAPSWAPGVRHPRPRAVTELSVQPERRLQETAEEQSQRVMSAKEERRAGRRRRAELHTEAGESRPRETPRSRNGKEVRLSAGRACQAAGRANTKFQG